jgi:hypothetical protein
MNSLVASPSGRKQRGEGVHILEENDQQHCESWPVYVASVGSMAGETLHEYLIDR